LHLKTQKKHRNSRTIKKHQEQIRELQLQVEEEQRARDDLRDQLLNSEKRNAILQGEKDELLHQAEAGKF
jgi:predicted RNase H-like nuclease (RuvC/YqgF family)